MTNEITWQVIVPKEMTRAVISLMHDGTTNGHLGVTKTFAKIRKRFYWVGYRADIERFCRSCTMCSTRRSSQKKDRAPLTSYRVGVPLERIALDILGPLPKTTSGMRYILVVMYYFTKWAEAYPIMNQGPDSQKVLSVDFVITLR